LAQASVTSVLSDIFTYVYAISDTWKLFIGKSVHISPDSRAWSPLQLSIPFYYKTPPDLPYPLKNEILVKKTLACRPKLTLRLSCLAKHGPGCLLELDEDDKTKPMTSAPDTATYHLSPETTAFVLAHGPGWSSTNFKGTSTERSMCMDMILTDLWDDVDGQLTAWEQLYVRAYVKCYLAWYWKESDGSDSNGEETSSMESSEIREEIEEGGSAGRW
jgi:hypothetical protein